MKRLEGFQRKHLRGLAHKLKPVAFIGQKGITDAVSGAIGEALDTHELIKLKFVEFKEKEQKRAIISAIEERTGCEMVGMIGHIAILYRQQRNPEKRSIELPKRRS